MAKAMANAMAKAMGGCSKVLGMAAPSNPFAKAYGDQ